MTLKEKEREGEHRRIVRAEAISQQQETDDTRRMALQQMEDARSGAVFEVARYHVKNHAEEKAGQERQEKHNKILQMPLSSVVGGRTTPHTVTEPAPWRGGRKSLPRKKKMLPSRQEPMTCFQEWATLYQMLKKAQSVKEPGET